MGLGKEAMRRQMLQVPKDGSDTRRTVLLPMAT